MYTLRSLYLYTANGKTKRSEPNGSRFFPIEYKVQTAVRLCL
jgi:hypothetical protein